MGNLEDTIRVLRTTVQEKCAERIEKARSLAVGKISCDKPLKEEYGTSSILKRKHGL
jgi:hypothetical protein